MFVTKISAARPVSSGLGHRNSKGTPTSTIFMKHDQREGDIQRDRGPVVSISEVPAGAMHPFVSSRPHSRVPPPK